jgi:hypothetical protein
MKAKNTWPGAVALALLLAAAGAQAREVYGDIGSEGAGVGFAQPIGSRDNIRVEVHGFKLSRSFSAGNVQYDGHARIAHAGIYGDFFPAPTVIPFRLTAGVLLGSDEIDATATSLTGFGVRLPPGVNRSSLTQSIHATARFPAVRPYIGLGFGHTPVAKKGFSAFFDAGVAYGRPHFSYDVPTEVTAFAGPKAVREEEQQLEDKLEKLRFYPVIKLGLTYRF